MYEIEAKVPITLSDFKRLQKQLKKEANFKGVSKKEDTYYNDTEKNYTRLRKLNKKHIFSFKVKEILSGIESNIEIEWGIKDPKKWNNFLDKFNIKPSIQKSKTTEAYEFKNFNVELNHITKLGYFLEIERIVDSKKKIPKAKRELIDIFKGFGYSQKAFEKRYYLELLKEK